MKNEKTRTLKQILDISQEVFGCRVYPGDPAPSPIVERRMSQGSLYNLSSFEMCAHNGTHLDAPFHFLNDGKTIDEISLEKTVGWCYVVACNCEIDAAIAEKILAKAKAADAAASKKILLQGSATVTEEAASIFAEHRLDLLGVESQSVGPVDSPMRVHQILLGAEVCLLEGICLQEATEGVWFLHAAPLRLAGFDGAPCRATLIQF